MVLICICLLSVFFFFVVVVFYFAGSVFTAGRGCSLVVVSRGYSLVVIHGLLIAVTALPAEHRL